MAPVKGTKGLFPQELAYMCWVKNVFFLANPEGPQGTSTVVG